MTSWSHFQCFAFIEKRNSRGKDRLFVRAGYPAFDFLVGLYEGGEIKEVSTWLLGGGRFVLEDGEKAQWHFTAENTQRNTICFGHGHGGGDDGDVVLMVVGTGRRFNDTLPQKILL